MPLYDYRCRTCGEVFEVRATIREKQAGLDPECPQCQSHEVQQVITAGLMIGGQDGASLIGGCCRPNAGPGCCG